MKYLLLFSALLILLGFGCEREVKEPTLLGVQKGCTVQPDGSKEALDGFYNGEPYNFQPLFLACPK